MLRYVLVTAALGLAGLGWSTPAAAQVDPVATGQGLVLSSTMRAHSNRIEARRRHSDRTAVRRGANPAPRDPAMVRLCGRDLAHYRRKHGGITDPDIRKLAAFCAKTGY